jgi:hypothetical protein
MWLLVVIMVSSVSGIPPHKGSLQVTFNTREECLEAREQFMKNVSVKNYRVSAGCMAKK